MSWSKWVRIGGPPGGLVGRPATLSRNPEVTSIVVRAADHALWQLSSSNGRWLGWTRHDGGPVLVSSPAVGSLGPDHEIVFAAGIDGRLWSRAWHSGSGWGGWNSLDANDSGMAGSPVATCRNVYVRGEDGALWQLDWSDGGRHGWVRHEAGRPIAADPAATAMGSDLEIVFAVGADGAVWSKGWTAATGWGGWDSLGAPSCGITGGLCAVSRRPDAINLYARGTDDALWQLGYRGGNWHGWSRHEGGSALTSEPSASSRGPDHELVVHRGRDAQLHLKWWESNLPTVDVNLVRVGGGRSIADEPATSLAMTRWICFQAGLNVGSVHHYRIGSGQAGALEIIDSLAEAEELADRWSARNSGLDVFVVRSMNVADGWSTVDGRPVAGPAPTNGHGPIVCGWQECDGACGTVPEPAPIPEQGRKVFAGVLRDDTTAVAVRAAAATWLSRFAGEDAQPDLLAALESERSTPVRHKIVAGLARVGDEDALPALAELVRWDPELATHAAFAQSVIAHRVGIGGYEPATAEESPLAPAPNGAPVTQVLESHDALTGAQLPDDTYGVIVGPGVAGLHCGGRRLAIAIDLTALARLLTTPTIAGLVATRSEPDGALHTSMLVLSWPATDNTAHVAVHRPNGTPAYVGTARVTGATVSFRLTAVRGPGARHSTITGTIAAGILDELTLSAGPALPPRTPEPL